MERVRGGEQVHELRHLAPVLDHHHFEAAKDMRLNGVCWLIVEAVADLRIRFRPNLENEYEVDYRLAFEADQLQPGSAWKCAAIVRCLVSSELDVYRRLAGDAVGAFRDLPRPDDVTSASGPSGLMPAHAESKDTALKATSANSRPTHDTSHEHQFATSARLRQCLNEGRAFSWSVRFTSRHTSPLAAFVWASKAVAYGRLSGIDSAVVG